MSATTHLQVRRGMQGREAVHSGRRPSQFSGLGHLGVGQLLAPLAVLLIDMDHRPSFGSQQVCLPRPLGELVSMP